MSSFIDEQSGKIKGGNFVGVAIIKALQALAVIAVVALVWYAITTSIEKSEVHECKKLDRISRESTVFFLTHWQNDMCVSHGYEIHARIIESNEN